MRITHRKFLEMDYWLVFSTLMDYAREVLLPLMHTAPLQVCINAIIVVDFKLCELRFVYEGGILWL